MMLLHLGRSCLTQLCRGRKEGREIKYIDIFFIFICWWYARTGISQHWGAMLFAEFPLEICRVWDFNFFFFLVWWFFFLTSFMPDVQREKKRSSVRHRVHWTHRGALGGVNFSIFSWHQLQAAMELLLLLFFPTPSFLEGKVSFLC